MSSTSLVHVHHHENTIAGSLDVKKLGVKKGTRYFSLWITGYEGEVEKSNLQKLINTISEKFKENIIKLRSYPALTICKGRDVVTWINELNFPGEQSDELSEGQKKLIDSIEKLIEQNGFRLAEKREAQEEQERRVEAKGVLYGQQGTCIIS